MGDPTFASYCAVSAAINSLEIGHALPTAVAMIQLQDLYPARSALAKQLPAIVLTGDACPECGKLISMSDNYCRHCGKLLKQNERSL